MSDEVPSTVAGETSSVPTGDVPTVVVSSGSPSSSSSPLPSSSSLPETDRMGSDQTSDPIPLRTVYPDGRVSEMGEQPISIDELIRRSGQSQQGGRVENSTPVERADTSGARQQMFLVDEEDEEEEEGDEGDAEDKEDGGEGESGQVSGEEEGERTDAGQGGEKKKKKKGRSSRRAIPPVLNPINPRVVG